MGHHGDRYFILFYFGADVEPVPQDHSKVWVSIRHAVVGLASYWQLYLWTGCEKGLTIDRTGKRHLLQHVWFEEWMVTLRRRHSAASEVSRR
jgi:hypothetical protein